MSFVILLAPVLMAYLFNIVLPQRFVPLVMRTRAVMLMIRNPLLVIVYIMVSISLFCLHTNNVLFRVVVLKPNIEASSLI